MVAQEARPHALHCAASFTFESGRNSEHVTGWFAAEGRIRWAQVGGHAW